jgi:hypothetical protein
MHQMLEMRPLDLKLINEKPQKFPRCRDNIGASFRRQALQHEQEITTLAKQSDPYRECRTVVK